LKVLVTGSEGFAGGHIVNYLINEGCDVVGLDDLSKYGYQRNNLNTKNYKFVKGDASDPKKIYKLIQDCDAIISLAARVGGVRYMQENPFEVFHQNMYLTLALGSALSMIKTRSIHSITISTSLVYEYETNFPSKEEDSINLCPPSHPYGFQKLSQERYIDALSKHLPNHKFTTIRPFNLIGTGEEICSQDIEIAKKNKEMALTHVIPDLIRKIQKNPREIEIFGDGLQIRNYVHAFDLAQAIKLILNNPEISNNKIYNVASESEDTVNVITLVKKISEAMKIKKEPTLKKTPTLGCDIMRNEPSIEKIKNELGYKPKFTLTETINYLVDLINLAKDGLS